MELSFLVDGEVYKARQLDRIFPEKIIAVGHHDEGEDLLDEGEEGDSHNHIVREG